MDARIYQAAVLMAAIASLGASQRTANFIVTAPSADAARQIATAAEKFRRELAVEWLGREMPAWSQPCPITVQVGERLGAGGATSFLFEHGEVFGWRMTIQGSLERILDSVLPHEITHTIFATHFRRPLPRWADEGACTTVEHPSERAKQQVMLVDFLRTGRGIAFSRMFAMKEYPHDVMPLYSEGYSLARFLVSQGGKRKFLNYLADGMRDENWPRATKEHYGYSNLAVLQDTWLNWVRRGSPSLENQVPQPEQSSPTVFAANQRRPRPEPNLIYRGQGDEVALNEPGKSFAANDGAVTRYPSPGPAPETDSSPGWHAPRSDDELGEGVEVAATNPAAAESPEAAAAHQVTRPQPVQKSRQIILEWSKPPRGEARASNPASSEDARSVYAQAVGR